MALAVMLLAFVLAACGAGGSDLVAKVTARSELAHPGAPHAAHVTDSALALAPDGTPHLAWVRRDAAGSSVQSVAFTGREPAPVRVDSSARPVAGGHQPPGLAVGADGRVHVSWSSPRKDPGASPFASDLVLATSSDRGRHFSAPLRLNDDRPGARGFESIAVDGQDAVVAAWIESGEGPATTRAVRVAEGVAGEVATLGAQTCPCCRIAVAAAAAGVGVLWRDELPGKVRDMVFAFAARGAAFAAAEPVRDDGWVFDACPHRGGALAFAPDDRALAAWYSEGRTAEPALWLAARGESGFGAPTALHEPGAGSHPDRVALAVGADGAGVVLWERRSPVRSEIAARAVSARGQLGPVRVLSNGVHASGPAIAAAPSGGFVAAWNEEAFPALRTVVVELALSSGP